MAKSTFAGFCLTAFACGILTTVAIDRVWPGGAFDASGRYEPTRPVTALPLSPPDPPRSAAVEIHQLPPSPAPVEIHQLPPPPAPVEIAELPTIAKRTSAQTVGRMPAPRQQASRAVTTPRTAPARRSAGLVEPPPLDDEPKEPAPGKKWVDPFE